MSSQADDCCHTDPECFVIFVIKIFKSITMKRKDRAPETAKEDRERNDALNKSEKDKGKKLPGDYPPQEDIMNRMNTDRVGLDVENFSRAIGHENLNKQNEPRVSRPDDIQQEPELGNVDDAEQPSAKEMERPVPRNLNLDEDDMEFTSGNESDVTSEDIEALGPKDLSMDMGDDENLLKHRVWPVDMAGEDLDIPGSELDDENESIGSEDEENNSYSIGGDRHEDQMEGK